MSAPQIPNLLESLRSGRGGHRGRGRGGGHAPDRHGANAQDKIVQQTDNDALGSRLSAVETGYLIDPFINAFATGPLQIRDPMINKGTYVRTTAIDMLVEKFLATDANQPKQIVSLGAGSDTRFFRILSTRTSVPLIYHEIDFPTNTRQKIAAIQRSPAMLSVITSHLANSADLFISDDLTSLRSPVYNVHPLDLRTLASTSTASEPATELPELPNLSSTTPTLILSECCLIYLSPAEADSVVDILTTKLIPAPTPLSFILYEPIKPNDPFGEVMVSNLKRRGIVLQTLRKYSTLLRQRERLKRFSFSSGQGSADVRFIWERWISAEEKQELDYRCRDPAIDGVEEWYLLIEHYCVAWGWRDGEGELFSTAWGGFSIQEPKQEDEDRG